MISPTRYRAILRLLTWRAKAPAGKDYALDWAARELAKRDRSIARLTETVRAMRGVRA